MHDFKVDIESARDRIKNTINKTELLENKEFNKKFGSRILIKPECNQKTGSFKFRGAYNFISKLHEEKNYSNVICFSSGNHGQAVAAAAKSFNIKATVLMPSVAPKYKILKTKEHNARVILHSGSRASMERKAINLAEEKNLKLIKPFDDPDIIAGQGTIGTEIASELKEKNIDLNAILTPCSGGGLAAGIALGVMKTFPEANIHSVEPNHFDDTRRSLKEGIIKFNAAGNHSICDALLVPSPGKVTFAINKQLLSEGFAVSDKNVIDAMRIGLKYFCLNLL